VNSRPAPQHPLARPLRACARGIYPDEAAIELLIGHGTFLDRDDFTRHITTSEHGRPGGKAAHAAIDWTAAATALDAGTLPCSGGERRIFHLAASLAAGLPVNLRDALARHARERILKISQDWPWKDAFLTCWQRLCALPAPA
jgi:hypothetical protein